MADDKKILALFDADHTLIDGSSGSMMIRYLYSLGRVPLSALFKELKFSILYTMNRLPYRQIYEWTAQLLAGLTVCEAMALTDEAHERYWLGRYFAEGREAIRKHKEMGHITVIATSATEYIAAIVRDQLGADDSFGTPVLLDESGIMLNQASDFITYGEGKLIAARKFAEKIGADLADAYFYSDSASDFPLLSATGYPIMVNPQRKLLKLARGKNWPIVWWSTHLEFRESAKPRFINGEDISHWRGETTGRK